MKMASKYTVYAAPITAPVIETITTDGINLIEPEGYEAVADRITVEEVVSAFAATIVTLVAEEEDFVLDRLASMLDEKDPIRLLLVGYPEEGICHATHLPTTTLEWSPSEDRLVVVGVRDFANEITMRRDFWFGENFDPAKMGFAPKS